MGELKMVSIIIGIFEHEISRFVMYIIKEQDNRQLTFFSERNFAYLNLYNSILLRRTGLKSDVIACTVILLYCCTVLKFLTNLGSFLATTVCRDILLGILFVKVGFCLKIHVTSMVIHVG